MNSAFTKIWCTVLCLFFFAFANSQVNFYTTVSSKEIGKDEFLSYRIIIENSSDIKSVIHPSFSDFLVLGSPATVNGVSDIKGQLTRYISIDYTLKPKRPGKFNIGQAVATIGNKTYRSNSNVVIVQKASSARNLNIPSMFDPNGNQRSLADFKDYIFHKGDSLAEKINKNMDFRIETDKTECYVGEPVIASYKLYTRLKTESKLTQSPSFAGFSVVYMQDPADMANNTRGKLNGKEYNVLTISKAQLYALQPGDINLESAELENNVQFIKEDYAKQMAEAGRVFDDFPTSFFPRDAVVTQQVALKTIPLNITVKPLPEKDKPPTFKGAVGNFTIEASLQKPLFSTDEAGKLTVTIFGNGNMQLLTAPDIEWPKGIESFEPKVTDKLVKETVPVSGNKKFEYSFAADDSGHYTLPAIQLSYFDPATAAYKIATTDPIAFQVTKGSGRPAEFAKLEAQIERPSFINRIFNHRWWMVVFIAGIIITGLIIWLIRDNKHTEEKLQPVIKEEDEAINEMIEASVVAQQNVFAETEKCLYTDDCFGFYTLLNIELKTWLANKLSVNANVVNSNSIVFIMDKKGIANDIVLKLQELMQQIEWQLYTPFERNEKMNELYREAQELVQMINVYDIRPL